jgi:hypothetical protein
MARLKGADIIAAGRELYSRSLKEFVKAAWSEVDPAPFVDNWHVDAICDHLEAVERGDINRLLINVPPGTAKSMIVSVLYPAWLWTRRPEAAIISTGYSFQFATRDTRKARSLIMSSWYQNHWDIKLDDDQNQKTLYLNQHHGLRECKSFTSLTGARGNLVIVDDPHSVDGGKSDLERSSTVETFLEAVPNRLNDLEKDAIIVVMQRLHENDVSGAIIERPDMGYVHLNIPMEYEGNKNKTIIGYSDPRTRDGELLFPKKFSPASLKKLKSSLGPFAYAGQYQQQPAPATGGFFEADWFHRYKPDELPKHLNKYMTSDHAPAGRETSDFNVFRIWGIDSGGHLWLVDSFRKKCELSEAFGVTTVNGKPTLGHVGALPMIKRHKPLSWFPEQDNTWHAVKSFAESFMLATDTFCHIQPLPMHGAGDKANKAGSYRAMASMRMVHLPVGIVGDEALTEYVKFPTGKHDDQVDADGAIGRVIADAQSAFAPPAPPTPEDCDYDDDRKDRDSGSYY